jgi:hypothetical protein
MGMTIRKLALAGVAAGVVAGTGAPAQAQNVQAGALTCNLSASVGMIVTSSKALACTFRNSRGNIELYDGVIRRFGLDVGATTGGQMVWSVFAPSGRLQRFALAGSYGGASGEATVGAGLGANVLVGGSGRSVALQPVSLQGQSGFNLALGVASLELTPADPPPRRR